jgi:hypothetical protein
MEKSGCKTLNELWNVAIKCNINDPGIGGSIGRTTNFVECKNIRDFMVMATLKCWEERGVKELPPIIIHDEINQNKTQIQTNKTPKTI